MEHQLLLSADAQEIRGILSLNCRDPLDLSDGLQISFRKSHGGDHTDIHKIRFIGHRICGEPHIRLRRPDTRKKRHSQSHDKQNRKISVQASFNFNKKILTLCFLHLPCTPAAFFLLACFVSLYHSIPSTGVGFSLTDMDDTCPFFILITRSAMGVRAELWVITTTVIPRSLQVS